MSQKIIVSKAGSNVLTESNLNNFIFHSDYNTFKIIATGTVSFTVTAGTSVGDFTLSHGLSYTPLIYAFGKKDSDANAIVPNEEFDYNSDPTGNFVFDRVSADGTNIHFYLTNADASDHTYTLRYYLFEIPL